MPPVAKAENQPLATSELTIPKVFEAVFYKRLFSDGLIVNALRSWFDKLTTNGKFIQSFLSFTIVIGEAVMRCKMAEHERKTANG
ncbi:MAG: hypothetical protein Q7S46_09780 [Gallionella sp.]|nr:hypothetical protein [Gallionella sp.]